MLVVVMYIICWMPYVLVVTIDHTDRLPLWTHLWATYLAHLHSSLNFIIYAVNSKDMRLAFAMAIGCRSDREVGDRGSQDSRRPTIMQAI